TLSCAFAIIAKASCLGRHQPGGTQSINTNTPQSLSHRRKARRLSRPVVVLLVLMPFVLGGWLLPLPGTSFYARVWYLMLWYFMADVVYGAIKGRPLWQWIRAILLRGSSND